MDEDSPNLQDLEAQRVFAKVARSMLGLPTALPTLGRFEVHERMGSGGMGEVYGAHDPENERDVAIKVLRRDRTADANAMRRMDREARVLMRLDHPNVVRVHEVGTIDDQLFIVMERLEGQTLSQRLREHGTLTPAQALAIITPVCAALERAHGLGIIHRDLKPANIFLVDDAAPDGVKVLDFGLAKIISSGTLDLSTASGTVMGTLHYMSPEQGRDTTKVDHRCDLWSVAVIAYECIIGERPFEAENLPLLAVKLMTEQPPVPSEHGPCPRGFDAWFAKATDRALERRFGSAAVMVDALADALALPRPGISPARVPRRRWLAPLALSAIAAAALVGWWAAPDDVPLETQVATEPVEHLEHDSPDAAASLPKTQNSSDTVEFRFSHLPDGAKIWLGDRIVCVAPDPLILERGDEPVRLRIEAEGFATTWLALTPTKNRTLSTPLSPQDDAATEPPGPRPPSSTPRPPKTPKSDVEDLEF